MNLDQLRLVHTALAEKDWVSAAQLVLIANEIESPLSHLAHAKGMTEAAFADEQIRMLFQNLVLGGDYLSASALIWNRDLFYQEPESVERVFKAMHREDMLLCMGASSMSKSYSLIAWEVIDWLLDPFFTSIKLTSQTEGHLLTNVWPHMMDMVKASVIQPKAEWQFKEADTWLGIKGHSMFYGFSGIAFKQSQVSAGAWKGFKPQPKRPKSDPLYKFFGPSTRLRVTVDEAQQVPHGTWTDLNSVMGSMGGGFVKINAAFNPEDMSQRAVQLAEPPEGWTSDLSETLYSYKSKEGWWVERLDGKQCENVVQRKDIFPRLMSYQTYLRYLAGGGDNSPKYWCVDDKTELLSKRGWLKHNEVKGDDIIYTLNPDTGLAEWCPMDGFFSKHFNGDLVSMEGKGFSAMVTKDHKWALTHKQRREAGLNHFTFKQTDKLKAFDLIPLIASGCDYPESVHGEDFASLVGWVFTDGTIFKHNRNVVIYQSHKSNPAKCKIVRDLISRLGGRFREWQRPDGMTVFSLYGEVAEKARKIMTTGKRIPYDFITSLTKSETVALMDAMILGDGGVQGYGNGRPVPTRYFCQKSESVAGLFQMIAARAGCATTHARRLIPGDSLSAIHKSRNYKYESCWMSYVNVRKSITTRPQNIKMSASFYDGIVWCPSTKNKTFYARRNGTTYFTGNTFCRGFPPLKDAANTVIPPDWVQSQRGEAIYIDKVEHFAAFDMAYQGQDKAVMGVARFGLASGWRKQNGNIVYFEDRLNAGKRKPRHVLTIDQVITMPKHRDTVTASQEVMGRCEKMKIAPENVALDMTGNALGTYSHLSKYWGGVLGIGWGEGSTDTLVIAGDKIMASETYEGLPSEMWFRFKRWLDPVVTAVLINPIVPTAPINTQLTSRRFRYVKNLRQRIESKDEYKARNAHVSPDEADVFVMLSHLAALRGGVVPGIIEQQDRNQGKNNDNAIKIQDNAIANGPMDMGARDGAVAMDFGTI